MLLMRRCSRSCSVSIQVSSEFSNPFFETISYFFSEVKLISNKNIAFVEYEGNSEAAIAMKGMNGFKMSADTELQISYAKI